MATYDSAVALAKKLIEAKGRTVTLTQRVDGAPADASKPWEPSVPVDTAHTVTMAIFSTNLSYIDGTTIHSAKKMALVAAASLAVVPSQKDIVTDGTDTFDISVVREIKPGDQAILYELGLVN